MKSPGFFEELFDVKTLKELEKKIVKASEQHQKFSNLFEDQFSMMGDLFEIFAEVFFLLHSSDGRVGVARYSVVKKKDDNGVDGYGIGVDGNPATVQVKFRSNSGVTLKERDLKQFGFQSQVLFKVKEESLNNMVVFTNTEGLHWHTNDNVFLGKIRAINGKMISYMIDNNHCFWVNVADLLKANTL